MAFWQENLPFIKGFFDERSQKFFDLMDRAEASIEQVNADKIYTSKEFKRIKDNFQNIIKNLERQEVRDWLSSTKELLAEEKKSTAEDENLRKIFDRFEGLMPRVNETKLVTDMLWKAYEYTDDLVPLMEFTNEQLSAATREVQTGSASQTEEITEKHGKVMDKLDKKQKEIRDILAKGEKLSGEPKAPEFLEKKLGEMKALWKQTNEAAKDRLTDLKNNTNAWNAFADKCSLLQTHVGTAQKQIADVKKLYDMDKAKVDYDERMKKGAAIKAEIDKTLAAVNEANATLQVLADDGTKAQLTQEVDDLTKACDVRTELDEKLAWLDNFNKSIVDYDKTATELENLVKKDRADLDGLIKPAEKIKSTDRLVCAMDLADDIRAQKEICAAKQSEWDDNLQPSNSKENTDEAKKFVARLEAVSDSLNKLEEEADGEAEKYGNDIVFMAEFQNSKNQFYAWIEKSEEKVKVGYVSPNNLEEANVLVADCKEWRSMCDKVKVVIDNGKVSAGKMTLHDNEDKEYEAMKIRWEVVDKSCTEWTKKLEDLSGMWTKQTDMLNKVTSTMVAGSGAGEQVNLNDLDSQMEQIKEMFVKKQEMMKKMSTGVAPDPAQLQAA
eukprot:TRINITY_DN3992_c0_g1_i5.p1 TRINITY_DN3992_c0_g1~~TRINITY_DN3992_c0_g1_i5.p1  ORF type:complete len:611 (-),score=263.36 TRINITY_DN3992_c0_g1_i5:389-2221(-)